MKTPIRGCDEPKALQSSERGTSRRLGGTKTLGHVTRSKVVLAVGCPITEQMNGFARLILRIHSGKVTQSATFVESIRDH